MGNKINIRINNLFDIVSDSGVSLFEVAYEYKKVTNKVVAGAKIDNNIVDFDTKIYSDADIEFFDYTTEEGNKIYLSGLKYLVVVAGKLLWNKTVNFKFSLDKGSYAEVDKRLSVKDIMDLKLKMREIIKADYKINKCVVKKEDAIKYYLSADEKEKAANIGNIPNSYVELYELNHTYNYFYSAMPPSTGELSYFNIEKVNSKGFVLMYPRIDTDNKVPKYTHNQKILDELLGYSNWTEDLNIRSVSDLNKIISQSKIQQFIKMNNIYINEKLHQVAKSIVKNKNIKLILIGGPSSSGKTTTSKKLYTYLSSYGVKPIVLSTDDYFKERKDTPKDKFGNYDYEGIDALDIELFNSQLKKLIAGKEVEIPTYNFLTGEKEYKGHREKLDDSGVLIIEGLHCLNDALTKSIKRENKHKILVCPFTPLSVDKHNHLSTTDMRLIRRIVRDNRTRGYSVEDTLSSWPKVRAGEYKYIFPYEGDVDSVLNTAFAYEIGVLRVYVEPLLYSISIDSKFYNESRRLLGAIRTFFPISSEYIEDDNILREFIGGSIYEK